MPRPKTTSNLIGRLQQPGTDSKERAALEALAAKMIELFHEKHQRSFVREAAALAPVVPLGSFMELISAFSSAIIADAGNNSLEPDLCREYLGVLRHIGVEQDGAEYKASDLKLGQSPGPYVRLESKDIGRENLHKPLLDQLKDLSASKEIRLAQAAGFAHEALRCIPDDEGPLKAFARNTGKVVEGACKIAGAVITMDPSKLVDGLVVIENMPEMLSAAIDQGKAVPETIESMKDGGSATLQKRHKRWYSDLRSADRLLQKRAFGELRELISDAPCRQDTDFLCGMYALLEHAWLEEEGSGHADTDSTQADIVRTINCLPPPKERSSNLITAWKDAVQDTIGPTSIITSTHQPRSKLKVFFAKPLQWGQHSYDVSHLPAQQGTLPSNLLTKAWLGCQEAQLFYADEALHEYYVASNEVLLQIQRISGELLPMERCYINLGIVAKNREAASSLCSDGAEPSVISLPEIFDKRECNDGVARVPRRILVYGRAGVGKTTLCKKIMHELTRRPVSRDMQPWAALYDRVLWLPLRNLKRHNGRSDLRLEDLMRCEFFPQADDAAIFSAALGDCGSGNDNGSRTLFLLDGFDEVSQQLDADNQMSRFLMWLLNRPDVLITSRPGATLPDAMSALDCELETTGFNDRQIKKYVYHASPTRDDAYAVLDHLFSSQLLKSLAKIPVQPDAICYVSSDNGMLPGTHGNPTQHFASTTAIYEAIECRLWCKDIPRLAKRFPDGNAITEEKARKLRLPKHIHSHVEDKIRLLQAMAFAGMCNEVVSFEQHHLDAIQMHMGLQFAGPIDDKLENISCLRASDASAPLSTADHRHHRQTRTYHFIHLTYQEYFAAQSFVSHWIPATELKCVTLSTGLSYPVNADDFLHDNRHNVRFHVFWQFVSGILRSEQDGDESHSSSTTPALTRLFNALEEPPRDLLGVKHRLFIEQCAHEADPSEKMPQFRPNRAALSR